MRILLILPYGGRSLFYPNLGLANLGTVLMRKGHEVRIIDFTINEAWLSAGDGYSLTQNTLKNYLDDVNNHSSHYEDEEIFLERILAFEIKNFRPDLAGIHVHCGNVFWAIQVAKVLLDNNIDVVLGGPEISDRSEYFLTKLPRLLGVVSGEGEKPIEEIAKCVALDKSLTSLKKIPNFSFNVRGEIIKSAIKWSADINKIPNPQWDLFELEPYKKHYGRLILPMQLSRGCSFHCRFCSITHLQKFRRRSIALFISELKNNIAIYECKRYRFNDSTFNFDKHACLEICNKIVNLKSSIKWGAYANVYNIDDEIAQSFKAAGCQYLYLGIESGNDTILRLMRKGFNRKRIIDCISSLRKFGIKILCSFIVGFPGESEETIQDTRELIHLVKPDAGFVFPFEMRDNTEALLLFSNLCNSVDSFANTDAKLLASNHSLVKKNIISNYGRILARELVLWQNTNILMNWLDILEKSKYLQSEINIHAKYNDEQELIADVLG